MAQTEIPWPDTEPDDERDNPLDIPNDQALAALLHHHASREAPRLFALCEVARGWRAARVAAWGMMFAGQAVVYLPGERTVGVCASPQRAAELFARGRDVHLVWPDPVPVRDMVET